MTYTVSELIADLSEAVELGGLSPAAEVLVAQQPSYPLEGALLGIVIDGDEVRLVSAEASEYSRRDLWERV